MYLRHTLTSVLKIKQPPASIMGSKWLRLYLDKLQYTVLNSNTWNGRKKDLLIKILLNSLNWNSNNITLMLYLYAIEQHTPPKKRYTPKGKIYTFFSNFNYLLVFLLNLVIESLHLIYHRPLLRSLEEGRVSIFVDLFQWISSHWASEEHKTKVWHLLYTPHVPYCFSYCQLYHFIC